MAIELELSGNDVTLAGTGQVSPDAVPARRFELKTLDQGGFELVFDARSAQVNAQHIQDLLAKVVKYSTAQWQYSSNMDIRAAFDPLNRIVQVINSTPSYQLFLAGFHIADAIGLFDRNVISDDRVVDSFRYLVGAVYWTGGKKRGWLFFLPEGFIQDDQVRSELITNGKIFKVILFRRSMDGQRIEDLKLFVPYALPIGFTTPISDETKRIWGEVNDLVQRNTRGTLK